MVEAGWFDFRKHLAYTQFRKEIECDNFAQPLQWRSRCLRRLRRLNKVTRTRCLRLPGSAAKGAGTTSMLTPLDAGCIFREGRRARLQPRTRRPESRRSRHG